MISIIICSRKADISQELKDNIAATIGCEYELCVIDNSRNEYSIFTAYNEGVRCAKGDILCFMHEDVLFHTEGWGDKVMNLLHRPDVGIVGIEGGHFLPSVPMYWSNTPFVSDYVIDNDYGRLENFFKCDYFDEDGVAEVVVCDGVFFAMKKDMFSHIRFDDDYYSGFHMYDMDLCMQIQQMGMQCIVTNTILLEHAWSEGDMKNKKGMDMFLVNLCKFVKKWEKMLPIWRGGPDLPEYSKERINKLCIHAYDARIARQSVTYRIGKAIISPYRKIKSFFRS